MLGISGGDPAFRSDNGSPNPEVAAALAEFASGQGSERAVLAALAASRLLIPVVAVLAEEPDPAEAVSAATQGAPNGAGSALGSDADAGPTETAPTLRAVGGGEKASDMAMPTLIGLDGRRAVPAFTSLQSMSRWQSDARPVPVAALAVWQTACADSAAVVIDVAGPVPFAVEGARLAALARGEEAPEPYRDSDVHEIVSAALANLLEVASFDLQPGDGDQDLAIVLTLNGEANPDAVARIGAQVAEVIQARLGGRLRRGIAIWLGDS
ncbi:MAG TPA: SseB family protein [Streptosporangiaceae bacterium]|nr:SseB family protein [Streptosporangiaceae bacterium]